MQLHQPDAFQEFKELLIAKLEKISGINKSCKKFMVHIMTLYLYLRGRYNFMNMERYGTYSEKSYRNHFSEKFDFMSLNKIMVQDHCSEHLILAFDPSFIPKSGKETDHCGYFYNGTASKPMKGLEIGVFAAIDVDNHTGFALEAIQTPSPNELKEQGKTLTDQYAQLVIDRKEPLQELSKYLVVDGYFAKQDFVLPILKETNLEIISKLRSDADLKYLHEGKQTGQRGRPKAYDGKVDVANIDKKRWVLCYEEGDDKEAIKVYQCILFSKTLKRNINVIYLEQCKKNQPTGKYAILFSTDLTLLGKWIYRYYKCRFQIEFLFRDAKQHCGLTHCQARDEHKMHFHFNASLMAVSFAKVAFHLQNDNTKKRPFSMADIKNICYNKLLADRIIANLEIKPSQQKIKEIYQQIIVLGTINEMAA